MQLAQGILMSCVHRSPKSTVNLEGNDELARSADGDHAAFQELYLTFAPRVFGLARAIIRDPALAEDVTQEVFLELWCKAGRFDPNKGSATAWIMTLTRSRTIDRIRIAELSRCRDRNWASNQGHRDTDTVIETVLLNLDHQEIRTALTTLTAAQHQAIMLTYFRGLDSGQVSRVLGISRSTAKTRTRDGLVKIRNRMNTPN